MRISRALTFIAIAAVFTRANGDVGGVCVEDGTAALAALETHLEATKTPDDPGALVECARAFLARACAQRGFGSTAPTSSHDSRATRACFARVCEVCLRGRLSFTAPRGGSWEKDRATETAEFSTRSARRAACSVCEPPRSYDVSETARIAPIDFWTSGWYASWLVFLAVDAVVAGSLGYWGPGYAVPAYPFPSAGNETNHPVLPPVIVDNVAVDPFWSPSVVVPPVTAAQELQEHQHPPSVPYVHSPPPTWSWPPPPPPPPPPEAASAAAAEALCSADDLAAALPTLAPSLVPCLAGASATCCAAVASAVGPDDTTTLPDCLCAPDAFEALAGVLAGIDVDLRALLEACASDGSVPAVAFAGDAGESCDARKRVAQPRAEAVAAVRARRTGRRTKGIAPSNARKT